jgi:hypothetical protein
MTNTAYVTVYLLTGEQITGIVAKDAVDDLPPMTQQTS